MEKQMHDAVTIKLKRGQYGLGFNITGGTDKPHLPQDSGLFVTKIRPLATAGSDGRLHEGDKILSVNGISLENKSHQEAVEIFLSAGDEVEMVVWQGAEDYLIKEYSNMSKINSMNGLTKLLILTGFVVIVSSCVYYARKKV